MPNVKQQAVAILLRLAKGCDHNSVSILSSGNTDQRFNKVEMNQALSSVLSFAAYSHTFCHVMNVIDIHCCF